MPKMRVKRDSHGLYIRTNGGIYRPERTKYTDHHRPFQTQITEGEQVNGHHISQTPTAKLTRANGDSEIWSVHGGCYVGYDEVTKKNFFIPSDNMWEPSQKG